MVIVAEDAANGPFAPEPPPRNLFARGTNPPDIAYAMPPKISSKASITSTAASHQRPTLERGRPAGGPPAPGPPSITGSAISVFGPCGKACEGGGCVERPGGV